MKLLNIIIAVILFALSGCNKQASQDSNLEKLPEVFFPINWDVDLKKLSLLFPASVKISELEYATAYKDKVNFIGIIGFKNKKLGTCRIAIVTCPLFSPTFN